MAKSFLLECYTFRLKKRRKESYLPFDNFDVGRQDFLNAFMNFVVSIQERIVCDEKSQRTIQLMPGTLHHASEQRTVCGFVECGAYGTRGPIKDIITGSNSYVKTKNDTDPQPYYFLIYLPKDDVNGLLILQRASTGGIQALFCKKLMEYLKDVHPHVVLDLGKWLSPDLKDALLQGDVKKMTFRKYSPGSDKIDAYTKMGLEDSLKCIEFVMHAKSEKTLFNRDKLRNEFYKQPDGIADIKLDLDIEELESLGFTGNFQKTICVTRNGQDRTIDLSDSNQIKPYYNIDGLEIDSETDYPTFVSVDRFAKKLLTDFITEAR